EGARVSSGARVRDAARREDGGDGRAAAPGDRELRSGGAGPDVGARGAGGAGPCGGAVRGKGQRGSVIRRNPGPGRLIVEHPHLVSLRETFPLPRGEEGKQA